MTDIDVYNFTIAVAEFSASVEHYRRIIAYQGAIAAMQAENAHRAACGNGPAYTDAEFYQAAKTYGFED